MGGMQETILCDNECEEERVQFYRPTLFAVMFSFHISSFARLCVIIRQSNCKKTGEMPGHVKTQVEALLATPKEGIPVNYRLCDV
jgi:hypothetical protein